MLSAAERSGLSREWAEIVEELYLKYRENPFMGPFATIALNAPGGVDDYCARYGEFFRALAADPARPSVWDDLNAARVGAALGDPPDAMERAARMRWRDRRLLALRRHKASEPDFDEGVSQ